MLIIGSHVNFINPHQLLGCVEQALSYNANTFMFYTGSNISTMRSKLNDETTKKAHQLMLDNNIDINNIICHAPYLINLANPEKNGFGKSFLKSEITRCKQLGIKKLVLHPGAAMKQERAIALNNIIDCLNEVLDNENQVTILLETMAIKGSECGSIDDITTIINGINNKNNIGICLDTCHLNDAGYDLKNLDELLDEIDNKIGINYIKCFHINDSKNEIGAHKDRHANIGLGTIGFDNIINIIYNPRLQNVPKILETPYLPDLNSKEREFPPYKFEIEMIRNKQFNSNLESDIIKYYNINN